MLIIENEISSSSDLIDETTPQYKALDWILFTDLGTCPEDHNLADRYALAVIYFATNGDLWSACNAVTSPNIAPCEEGDEGRFLSTGNECDWYGVVCDEQNEIYEILLRNNNLSGTIPNEIGTALQAVVSLELDQNVITGSIPDNIDNL